MEYSFLETSDEALIEGAKLPLEKGAAIGMFTTGYDVVNDETVVQVKAGSLFRLISPQVCDHHLL